MPKVKVYPCLTFFKVICPIFLLLNDFQLHGFKKSSHRIFRLNNIAKVLSFLEERNVSSSTCHMGTPPGLGLAEHIHACTFLQVKLVSIDAADVADGNASIILGLIWNIILFFQVTFLLFSTLPVRCKIQTIKVALALPTSSEAEGSKVT